MSRKVLEKYSLGVGDRFAHQAKPQLAACIKAAQQGVIIVPVWNKSNREHKIVGSDPSGTRAAADRAVGELAWPHSYYLDADHIDRNTVDRFLAPCDFFTLDVAETIGAAPPPGSEDAFLRKHPELIGRIGIAEPLAITSGPGTRSGSQIPGRYKPGGRNLSPHCGAQRRGHLRHRNFHG